MVEFEVGEEVILDADPRKWEVKKRYRTDPNGSFRYYDIRFRDEEYLVEANRLKKILDT